MNRSKYIEHEVLLHWLIGVGVLLFALFVVWREGLFTLLVDGDKSRLSLVIILCFLAVNVHVLSRVLALSRERNAVAAVRRLLSGGNPVSIAVDGNTIQCCGQTLSDSLVARHLRNLTGRMSVNSPLQETGGIQTHLLDALAKRIQGGQKYGWMFADLMIKLGLMGTVVGFVLMLGSVATLEQYDVSAMQELLRSMSGGMRVALFTTLSGLVAGLILGIQYQFLDRHADELLADIEELTEVYVLPALAKGAVRIQES
jgi:hypothetical protein